MKCAVMWSVFLTMSLLVGCNSATPNVVPETSPSGGSPVVEEQLIVEGGNYNTVYEHFNEQINELGLLINGPDETVTEFLSDLEVYNHVNDSSESMLIIPKYNGSKVTVSTVEYTGTGFITKDTVYVKEATTEGYGLHLYAYRSEGIPELMVTVTYKNKSINYLVQADGRIGNEGIEYLTLEPEEEIFGIEGEVVSPIQDPNYLEGMTRLSRFEVDFDGDGQQDVVEVYSDCYLDDNGYPLLDDGQVWTLIVRKDDVIYPLFEKGYIQLGGIEYKVYSDYRDNSKVHI